MSTLAQGSLAPDFDLPAEGGSRIKLSDLRGRKVVLYFYPKDNTSGCTLEAIDFSARKADFEAVETIVVGVSPDSVKSHDSFRRKHDLSIRLASDENHAMLESYGVWAEKSMFGHKYMGVVRTTYLIDRDGRIVQVWDKVKVKGHVDEVLAAARSA
ncbi:MULTISPECIES: thioredoxin-dependent thiol peroxidase [Kaistia]|uniref:thioredoxin-dependent peroxiredoxin n=1 Tax=Kaistia nematophila TaxID=2994654 RepID=A0A9X3E3Y8_9HYPH|nr:thioredoxin-dependent thiol peroxidase [Kaistia nematophila]MBN9025475.1 thioredoxin-dependent thiol peroxidase [Hyphomicrobiales bacterium]MCX5570713.1 thioredoxin-dependent thiol peroxidase [Kaistia nematophila]